MTKDQLKEAIVKADDAKRMVIEKCTRILDDVSRTADRTSMHPELLRQHALTELNYAANTFQTMIASIFKS